MKSFLRFADNKPFVFTLFTLLIWIALAGFVNGLVVFIFKTSLDNPIVLQTGNLVATCILLIFTLRQGWFHKIGITKFGTLSTWLIKHYHTLTESDE